MFLYPEEILMPIRLKHEGTFSKRKDGRWQGQIQLDGVRYTVYGTKKTDAQEKLRLLVQKHDSGIKLKPKDYTLAEWAIFWLEDILKIKVRRNSFLQQSGIVKRHIIPNLGYIALQKLTFINVQQLVKEKLDSGLSAVTVKKIRNTLCAIIQYAVDTDLLAKNFVKLVVVKVAKKREVRSLTVEQLQQILRAAEGHKLYPALVLLANTGLRRSELCGLKWSDVNWQQRTMNIQRAAVKLDGEGILVHNTKTRSSKRILPLNNEAFDALQQLSNQTDNSRDEYIFAFSDSQPINPEAVLKFIKRIGTKLDMPYLTVHMFRHTAASLLLEAGENPKIVQELLGHSSIGITMDVYSHVIPGMKAQAINRLTNIINASAVKSAVKNAEIQ